MSEFLKSVKADLLDRRLLPVVALVGLALLAAVGYAVMGGGSSAAPAPTSANIAPVTPASGIAVSGTTTEKAVAETTNGASEQRAGHARNPFEAIAGSSTETGSTSKTASTATGEPTTSKSSSSSSSTSTGSTETTKSGGSGSKPATKKKKSTTVYHVAIEFGVFPPGSTPETVLLTPYENLKLQTPLPSAKQPLIVFRGVTKGAKSATFSIVGEAILHGIGACLPSPAQCQALDLKPGQSEQLEYLPASGETIVYELRVVSIAASKATTASIARAWGASKAGREVLRRAGLTELPFLRYSSQPGVLVFPTRPAFAARAHVALEPRRRSR
jgi:hypothetical protein